MRPVLTFTTDFGTRDPYVAQMKAVALQLCPECTLLDLSHEIGAQDVVETALFVEVALPLFPPGTVHVVVVDPGVGGERRPIVVKALEQIIVCPDNGLLTLLLKKSPPSELRVITNRHWQRREISRTFHGRDIFTPVAVRLAAGAPMEEVGPAVDTWMQLDIPQAEKDAGGNIFGEVIHIDRYGNCITNIEQNMVGGEREYRVQVGALTLPGIVPYYACVPQKHPLALFGSSGRLEISINCGNASQALHIQRGTPVTLFVP